MKKPSEAAMRAIDEIEGERLLDWEKAEIIDKEFVAVYKFIRNEASGPVVFSLDPTKSNYIVARELLEDLGIPLEEE